MATKEITDSFKIFAVSQIEESFTEPHNTIYYMCAHRSLPWDNDAVPPDVEITVEEKFRLYDEMLFGKHITGDDFKVSIKRKDWVFGTVYDRYDSKVNLADKDFYVVSQELGEYHVFKCIDNNQGAPSEAKPLRSETSEDDSVYKTYDGYVWKFMFSISTTEWDKFATEEFIPIIYNANVVANSVPGTIDSIAIIDSGSNYNSYANGSIKETKIGGNGQIHSLQSDTVTLSSNTDFYRGSSLYIRSGKGAGQIRRIDEYIVTGSERRVLLSSNFDIDVDQTSIFEIAPRVEITGDGTGAEAIVSINAVSSNSVHSIEVIDRGQNYTFADVRIVGNTGALGMSTWANVEPVISPRDGHGANAALELFGTQFTISVEFDKDELGTIPATNDYRRVSILEEPRFANVELTLESSALSYSPEEKVFQADPDNEGVNFAEGIVSNRDGTTLRVRNIRGFFQVGREVQGETSSYSANVVSIDRTFETFDQRRIYQGDVIYNGNDGQGFSGDQIITQTTSNATGYIHSVEEVANVAIISIVDNKGEFLIEEDPGLNINRVVGAGNFAELILTGEDRTRNKLMDNSGSFFFIENFQPIQRDEEQREKIKVVVTF